MAKCPTLCSFSPRPREGANRPTWTMRIHSRLQLVAALLCTLILWACHVNRPVIDHAAQQNLYSAIPNDPRTFNPILVTDATSGRLLEDVFESFLQVNFRTLLPEPRIAQS